MQSNESFSSWDTMEPDTERFGRPPAALMKRLRARIARRPGRWRKRMQTRKRRKHEQELPHAA